MIGVTVHHDGVDIGRLGKGIYIINNRKVVISGR